MSVLAKKILFVITALLYSALVPIIVLLMFHLFFADFYAKGFLTGLGHLLICAVMVVLNVIIIPIVTLRFYNKLILENAVRGNAQFAKIVFVTTAISILVQIVLNILIENPFIDPPSPSFF